MHYLAKSEDTDKTYLKAVFHQSKKTFSGTEIQYFIDILDDNPLKYKLDSSIASQRIAF